MGDMDVHLSGCLHRLAPMVSRSASAARHEARASPSMPGMLINRRDDEREQTENEKMRQQQKEGAAGEKEKEKEEETNSRSPVSGIDWVYRDVCDWCRTGRNGGGKAYMYGCVYR